MSGPVAPFGIVRTRLDEITERHAEALERAERTIGYALITDGDIKPDELIAVVKWMSAVRFAVMIEGEGREPHESDFAAFADAVCEAAAS